MECDREKAVVEGGTEARDGPGTGKEREGALRLDLSASDIASTHYHISSTLVSISCPPR